MIFQVQQVKINPLYGRLPRGENAADIFRWHPNDSLFPAHQLAVAKSYSCFTTTAQLFSTRNRDHE